MTVLASFQFTAKPLLRLRAKPKRTAEQFLGWFPVGLSAFEGGGVCKGASCKTNRRHGGHGCVVCHIVVFVRSLVLENLF